MKIKPGDKVSIWWHGEQIEIVVKAIKDGVIVFE
jgi:hypothetical protein